MLETALRLSRSAGSWGMLGVAALWCSPNLYAQAPEQAQTPGQAQAPEHTQAPGQAAVSEHVVPDDRYPERQVHFPGGVVGKPDLVYAVVPGFRPLHLDLYQPPPAAGTAPHPFVVYVHGGGWMSGHTRQSGAFSNWPEVLASLAARGYVVASVEYRFSAEARFPAAEQDVKAAIRWLRVHAGIYGIDKSRGLVWGASAGGQLAALAATSCGVAELEPLATAAVAAGEPPGPSSPAGTPGRPPRPSSPAGTPGKPPGPSSLAGTPGKPPGPSSPAGTPGKPVSSGALESDCVQAAVTWYGVFDFGSLAAQRGPTAPAPAGTGDSADVRYLGCRISECSPAVIAAASPVTYIKHDSPPMLLVHGVMDKTVPVQQSQEMYDKLRAAGVDAQLFLIPDVDHSFIGKTPEATREASRAGLARVFRFIDATLKGAGSAP